ncbi:interferon-induced very large GTPase 1-like [Anguilla anguilla]|uniref:interferon-induced very large GTPase 1-like n=1 Tax=Anguilla anguilla TaxID=7936 RepID=UPI0015AF3F7B|nr:interferon-induced very large GTPase 1-like [Anguilla anguilla]
MSEETVFHMVTKDMPSAYVVQHADEQNTAENTTASEKKGSFMHLLEKLGLSGSYPKMMTKKDVLVINSLSRSINQPTTEKELSNLYLYKLMTLDYQARYLRVEPEAGSMSLNDGGVIAEDEDFFDCGDSTVQNVCSKLKQIHPMDIHMAIFHCSSDFLREYVFAKLSACQFSLPILVPNPCTEELEFPSWALQNIRKSWQSKNGSGKYNNIKMFDIPVPIVSFIRLGSSDFNSKSQILNAVICNQRHNVFFHRHCRDRTSNSLLMNGVVEIAWYCPGGKKNDIFDDCVAFLNLHGDAAEHPKQLEFLRAVSTVNVLLLSEHDMSEAAKNISQELYQSPVPLICLFSGKEHIQQPTKPRTVRIAAKNRNQAELTDELTSQIKRCICLNKQTKSLEGCSTAAKELQFKVDEDNKSCQDAYSQAKKLTCLLKKGNVPTLKERLLPLQGELWRDWCIKDKDQYRLQVKEKESLEQQLSRISDEMTSIRLRQLETPLSEFMRLFLECLTSVNEDTILYRLQWLRILLDDISTEALAELDKNYLATWRKIREVKKDKEKATHVHQMESELSSICDKMATTTVGLQHLMREVGQLYEANQMTAKGKENTKQYSSSLPDIGVKMLLSGYPLELMDGDTAHVPVKWIEAVLEKLTETCGDKKLFVLSILGLQSSGKSTLLNTMFGVQFSVSAGRCTRGAFMQLIPVDSSISDQLGYDFVLIVDTEGLRSPELSTKISVNHDNELATFIIGIGDITVINIMGENPSEMQDILQICVQAFLRMKLVKITPSCIFVHQNVADESAGEKNMEGRRRLLQKLDNMATIAAKGENIDGINEFSDVIQFDIESQVFYFKNLLEGDPPMAPPNPSYSQNVQELKTKLLTIAEWKTKHTFSSFSEFKSRVGDLWKALLQENFVFSFRNTVEMMVYTSLEEKYAAWTWELRKYALEMQSKLCNQIGSNLIQDVNVPDLMEDFNNKVYNQLQQEIQKYFTEDKHRETLITWRANIDKRFSNLRTELIDGTVKKCKELVIFKKNISALDQKKTEYTAQLTKQSKTIASNLKTQRLDDMQVTKEFDKLWQNWTAEVDKAYIPDEFVNVKAVVETILLKHFEKQPNVFQKINGETGKFEFDKKIHVSKIKWITSLRQDVSEPVLQDVNYAVTKYVTAKEKSKEDFNESFIYEILKTIEMTIAEFEHSTAAQRTGVEAEILEVAAVKGRKKKGSSHHCGRDKKGRATAPEQQQSAAAASEQRQSTVCAPEQQQSAAANPEQLPAVTTPQEGHKLLAGLAAGAHLNLLALMSMQAFKDQHNPRNGRVAGASVAATPDDSTPREETSKGYRVIGIPVDHVAGGNRRNSRELNLEKSGVLPHWEGSLLPHTLGTGGSLAGGRSKEPDPDRADHALSPP